MTLAGRLLQTSLTHFKLKKICLSQPSLYSFEAFEGKQEEIVQFTKCKQPDESLKERLW